MSIAAKLLPFLRQNTSHFAYANFRQVYDTQLSPIFNSELSLLKSQTQLVEWDRLHLSYCPSLLFFTKIHVVTDVHVFFSSPVAGEKFSCQVAYRQHIYRDEHKLIKLSGMLQI